MKRLIFTLLLGLIGFTFMFAQSPEAINYQAVARDAGGALLANQSMTVRLGVYSGPGAATKVYEETHAITTNAFGLFSLRIGEGTALSGSMAAISWDTDEHHLKVEVDPGSGYEDLGTAQFVSVPYSMHATTAESADIASDMELNDLTNVSAGSPAMNDVLSWNGSAWVPGAASSGPWQGTTDISYSGGSVGIGTASPDMSLHVHESSGISYVRVSDAGSGPTSGLRMGMSGSGNAYIINDATTKSLSIGTEGTTRMRIMDNGHIGINDLSPDMMVHVKQDVANRAIRIEHQSTIDYWDVGIGTTTKNFKFYYNNLFRADISSVDGAYTQSSDRRLKRDIEYMGSVLDRIRQLKPATYHYVDNGADAPRSTGFVAQEVEVVFPNLVRDMEDGYKGVVYDGFAVISIRAIQELNEKIERLEKEVESLKAASNK